MNRKASWILLTNFLLLGIILFLLFTSLGNEMGKHSLPTTSSTLSSSQNSSLSQPPLPIEKKPIALTFDDGPDEIYTPMLLDGLKERNIKATFFLLGKQIKKNPKIVLRMYEDGHILGCHSYEHVNFGQIPEESACKQIRETCTLLYKLTGEYPSFVRPPYGVWPSCLDKDFCMIPVLWNVDPLDWTTHDSSLVTNRILSETEEYSIILLHDASESSIQAAFSVIDTLLDQGYEFVTVDDLIMP